MNESAQSDTTSDSEYDEEQELTTAEEEEDEEDSIAPEEDVADEEEVNSLVKESQMSLEELLASYGVPTLGLNIAAPTSQNGSRSRASRAAVRRSTAAANGSTSQQGDTASPSTDQGGATAVPSVDSRSSSPTVKRSRRTNPSPSPTDPTPDSDHSISVRKSDRPSADRVKDGAWSKESPAPLALDLDVSGDQTQKTPSSTDHASHTNSPLSTPHETSSSQRSSRRRTPADKSSTAIGPNELPSAPFTSAHSPAPITADGSLPLTPAPMDLDSSAVPPVPVPVDSEPTAVDNPPDLECDESRDSVRGDSYSSRFWQKAITGGESPPSYNSDEDEDYAPSVESGHDWRGEIHVGEDYQATVPPGPTPPGESADWWDTRRFEVESSLLWQPGKLPEVEVIRFERLFAQTVMFPLPSERTVDDEEALFMLMQCNYDADEALQRLRFRTVSPGEIPGYMESWSEADAIAFEKGFALYSKDFRQIRDTRLRHKTVADLVHYYYLWKKSARHDEFARAYRRDKRKSPHPSMTDFMDCLVMEQEAVAEAYVTHLNDANVGSFHLVNRLSPGHHHPHHEHGSAASRYLAHPDPHMLANPTAPTTTSTAPVENTRAPDRSAVVNPGVQGSAAAIPRVENGREKTSTAVPASPGSAILKPTEATGRSTARTTSISV